MLKDTLKSAPLSDHLCCFNGTRRIERGMKRAAASWTSCFNISGRNDEIGRLEQSFNAMSSQLKIMRENERQEEAFR
ncbi:HAMP domain-containing protein [Paenibacillus rhizosphaerae]|uniref:HAMP domain-containing protein n=1 Tax=Paenibacillus rhizosphaerae TaxID=297318 RepID=UPI003D76A36E